MCSLLVTLAVLTLPIQASGDDRDEPPRGEHPPSADRIAPSQSPHIVWPISRQYHRLYPDRVSVLEPTFRCLFGTCWDAAITYSVGKLEAIESASGRTIWPKPVPCRVEPTLLGMDGERYIFTTPHRIFALARSNGRRVWQVGRAPPNDPGADPESVASWVAHFTSSMTDGRLYSASDRGELLSINLRTGAVRWRRPTTTRTAGLMTADSRYVCYATWLDGQNTISILDADRGRLLQTARLEDDQAIQTLRSLPDQTLLAATSQAIQAIEPATGKIRWRVDTPHHFVPSTLHVDLRGLCISDDGRCITKYAFPRGNILWRTPPIGIDPREGLWTETKCRGGWLFAATADTLVKLNAYDGYISWKVKNPAGLQLQPPLFEANTTTTIAPTRPDNDLETSTQPHASETDTATRYLIRAYASWDGSEQTIADGTSLLTEPLTSFGGLFVRDDCLILLDGNRLIGYVGQVGSSGRQIPGKRQ